MAASLSYTYLVMSSGEKTDSNPFLDFALQALAEIPSIYLAAWLSDRIGRRYTGITSISVLAVMWTTVIIRENSKLKIVINIFFYIIIQFLNDTLIHATF